MASKSFKYFLKPSSKKYLQVEVYSDGLSVYNIYANDGKEISMMYQNGTSDLEMHEFIDVGRILEIDKQVQSGKLEYDPYLLWTKEQKDCYQNE